MTTIEATTLCLSGGPSVAPAHPVESIRLSTWKFPVQEKNKTIQSPPKSNFTLDNGRVKVRDFAFEPSTLPPVPSYQPPSPIVARRKQRPTVPSPSITSSIDLSQLIAPASAIPKQEPNLVLHIGLSRRKPGTSPRQGPQRTTPPIQQPIAEVQPTQPPPSPFDLGVSSSTPSASTIPMRSPSVKRKREQEATDIVGHIRKSSRTEAPDAYQSFTLLPGGPDPSTRPRSFSSSTRQSLDMSLAGPCRLRSLTVSGQLYLNNNRPCVIAEGDFEK